jgi:DNA polymerase-3 subunit delta
LKVALKQLDRHLARELAHIYLIAGDEPLLVDEALEQVRAAARRKGFDSREVHTTDRFFRWAEIEGEADNLSLFASRKIVELRMPSQRPGTEGAHVLETWAERKDPDRVVLIAVPEKLDFGSKRPAWADAIEQHGVFIEIWPVGRAELPGWIQERAAAAKVKLTSAAAQLIADRTEGHLLAANQEIQRLALENPGGSKQLDEADVLASVANNSRFDVYKLADAVLGGESGRAFKILAGLREEGTAPQLVSWALVRDIELLASVHYAVRRGDNVDAALARNRVWRSRQGLVKQALRKFPSKRLRALITQAADVDAVLKGVVPAEPWTTLTGLLLAMLRPAANA